ncbi:hypothetical protein V8F33_001122 [Rhypophila sp. PSN 637]
MLRQHWIKGVYCTSASCTSSSSLYMYSVQLTLARYYLVRTLPQQPRAKRPNDTVCPESAEGALGWPAVNRSSSLPHRSALGLWDSGGPLPFYSRLLPLLARSTHGSVDGCLASGTSADGAPHQSVFPCCPKAAAASSRLRISRLVLLQVCFFASYRLQPISHTCGRSRRVSPADKRSWGSSMFRSGGTSLSALPTTRLATARRTYLLSGSDLLCCVSQTLLLGYSTSGNRGSSIQRYGAVHVSSYH